MKTSTDHDLMYLATLAVAMEKAQIYNEKKFFIKLRERLILLRSKTMGFPDGIC